MDIETEITEHLDAFARTSEHLYTAADDGVWRGWGQFLSRLRSVGWPGRALPAVQSHLALALNNSHAEHIKLFCMKIVESLGPNGFPV